MTLEPMLRAIAGTFVAASVLLGIYVHPYFLWFTLFVGLNLLQSGFTNWCPMISFLRHLDVREAAAQENRPPTLTDITRARPRYVQNTMSRSAVSGHSIDKKTA